MPKLDDKKEEAQNEAPEQEGKPTPDDSVEEIDRGKPRAAKSENLIGEFYTGLIEKTYHESSFWSDSMSKPYNPDPLFQKTSDYSIYEEMLKDDQINVCLSLKKDLVLASGWDIIPGDSDNEDTEVKDYLEKCLNEDIDTPIDSLLEEILTAYEFGFSLTEKIFKLNPEGMLALKVLKTRHPATWLIHTDERGNVTNYEQRGRKESISVDPKSLIHYINNPRFQNPYGNSDLQPAYAAYFVKRQIIKFLAIFLEKAAGPMPVAKYPTNTPKQAVDDLFDTIKKFQVKTALALPKEVEIEFLESKNTGEAYHKAINIFNMFIGRSLMIPDLLGFQGTESGGGSYSLGTEQAQILYKHINRRRSTLERFVNREIIQPIVVYNFGMMEKFPKFKFKPIRDEDAIELGKLWIELQKGKFYKPTEEEINYFRKLTKFPEGEVELTEDEPQQQIDPQTGLPVDPMINGEMHDEINPEKQPDKDGEQKGMEKDAVIPTGGDADDGAIPPKPGKKINNPKKNRGVKPYAVTPGDYRKKVDFKAIKAYLDRFEHKVVQEAKPVIQKIFKDLGDQIAKKKIIQQQKPEKIDKLKLKYLGEFERVIQNNLATAYEEAKLIGKTELGSSAKKKFAAPLPDKDFLRVLEEENYQFIGDWEYAITKKARIAIIAAIKDGKSISDVLRILEEDGLPASLTSLERYARTKFTEVANKGRLEYFNASGIVAAYQYSAILDEVTTDLCENLHGTIFENGDEPVPPLHFNCRSMLIPITKYEDYKATDKIGKQGIDEYIEENIGAGFSIK